MYVRITRTSVEKVEYLTVGLRNRPLMPPTVRGPAELSASGTGASKPSSKSLPRPVDVCRT